jgi:prepilin-type processing-associated H-X9-DG protein
VELLVVVAILAILASILFPVFARSREKARQIGCASNLRQIGIALRMYRSDNDETNTQASYPFTEQMDADYYWAPFDDTVSPLNGPPGPLGVTYREGAIWPYVKNLSLFRCPTVPDYQLGYGMNNRPEGPSGREDAVIVNGSETLLVFDHESITPPICGILDPRHHQNGSRHNETLNALWCDGHVKAGRGTSVEPWMFSVAGR